nr:S-layer homology domain-containing protein [Priestia taiwanensis]
MLVANALQLPLREVTFSDIGQIEISLQEGIKKAASAGIIKGSDDGKFNPTKKVSRQEMAVIIDHAMAYKKMKSPEINVIFTDKASIKYQDAVGRVVGAKLMTGIGNQMFDPEGLVTRRMATVSLNNMVAYFENGGLIPIHSLTGSKAPIESPEPFKEK